MKKYCILISAAILSIFALSCSKNEIRDNSQKPAEEQQGNTELGEVPEGYVRLVFGADAELTRTSIADGENDKRIVSWVAGDKVKVSYAGGSSSTQAAESGALTHFTVDVPQGTEQLYFSYPYDAAAALNASTLSLTIPAEQDGAFANANYVLAAASVTDENVHFYNAGALFKVVLDDASITKAVISGNNGEALCGTVPFTFSVDGITPGTPASTGTSITINFNGAGTYYVSALPDLSLSDGATIRFYRDDKPAGSAKWSGQREIERAQIASWGNSDAITCRFVRANAAAGKNGRSWENAWGTAELKAFLTNSAARTAEQLELMDGITIKIAAGTYAMAESDGDNTQVDWSAYDGTLNFSFVGGYPAAGGDTSAPSTNETILSGDDKGCVLWVLQKSNLSFEGITFSHGKTSAGGKAAFVLNNAGEASIKNCKFTSNENTATAGALGLTGGGTFTVDNCEFSSNKAYHAAAFNIDGETTTVTVTNCDFNNNTAADGGNSGALKVTKGNLTISDCNFTGNSSGNHGGAFWVSGGTTTATNLVFKGNSSKWGGVLYANKDAYSDAPVATFTSCTFGGSTDGEPNTASSCGGVLACDLGTINFIRCTFTKNSASDRGGAIFINNSGSVVNIGTDDVENSGGAFLSHEAAHGGVVALQNGALLKAYNAEFGSNSATSHGGVICVTQGSPTVRLGNNNFHHNSASSVGGVIAVKGSGTVSTPNSPKVYIEDGNVFKDNTAPNGGGAIRLRDEPVKATDGETAGNETKACLYVSGTNTFTSNHSTSGYGGCMDLRTSGVVEIEGATFYGNYTENDVDSAKGGAINLSDSGLGTGDFSISNCIFESNYTNGSSKAAVGGAINVGGNNTNWALKAKIDKCLFKDNHAKQGGAISFQDLSASTWINDCTFTGNYIKATYGTTINAGNHASVCLNNCSFADNTYGINCTTAQQATWVNLKGVSKLVVSNSTMIGVNRITDNATATFNTNPNLLRYDGTLATSFLVNNIIAPADAQGKAIDAKSNAVTAKNNKRGAVLNGESYSGSGTESDGYLGTNAYFGDLAWQGSASPASWTNRYWKWNGTLSGGNNTDKATLADVKSAIQNADADFYAWLNSIDALDKDCRGKARGTTTWPGAYDGTND